MSTITGRPTSPTYAAALDYARRGWFVFPVDPPRPGDRESGKHPLGALVPNGKDDASSDIRQVHQWWSRRPDANVGINLMMSRLAVLDVDVGTKKDGTRKRGAESLRELEVQGVLSRTLTAITGGGGLHAFYVSDPDITASKIGFRDGLDLIVSGYVVAPPSAHYTGGHYKWSDEIAPVPLPKRLVELATARKSPAESTLPAERVGEEVIEEGGRNIALFRVGCALRDTGIGENALKSALHFENQRRFSPPLADDEVALIASSVMRRVQPKRDVALGAVVDEIAASTVEATEPRRRARWARDVASDLAPPHRFYSTGFDQLDTLLGGGICTRQIFGVIGPPSAGKSAFVGSVLDHIQRSAPVLHVSTELPHEEMFVRYSALRGGFPWRDGLKGLVPRDKMRTLVDDLRVALVGSDDLDLERPLECIFEEAATMRAKLGVPPVVAIDYVQLLARGSDENKKHKVGELTMRIRQCSQALDIATVAVFSTRRDFYSGTKLEELRATDDPTVYLAAAKESGDIEFDCATIVFLDVDKLHHGLPKPGRIAVARCRVGDIGFAGARAQLDVGKWWGDPSATAELADDSRRVAKENDKADRECERLMEIMHRMPMRPWVELRRQTGWNGKRADAARDRLLLDGKIEYVKEEYHDRNLRLKTREVMRVKLGTTPTAEASG